MPDYAIDYSTRIESAIGVQSFAQTYKCDYRLLSNASKAYNYASMYYGNGSLLNTFRSILSRLVGNHVTFSLNDNIIEIDQLSEPLSSRYLILRPCIYPF